MAAQRDLRLRREPAQPVPLRGLEHCLLPVAAIRRMRLARVRQRLQECGLRQVHLCRNLLPELVFDDRAWRDEHHRRGVAFKRDIRECIHLQHA